MRKNKLILVLTLLLTSFGLLLPKAGEAKIWTKDLVDTVTLDSGYRMRLCTIDIHYDRSNSADNVLDVAEKDFDANPTAYPCNGKDHQEVLFANITLNFSKTNWNGGSAPEKLIQFKDKLYSVNGYGSFSEDENGMAATDDISPKDWFAPIPGVRGIRGDNLINTDPTVEEKDNNLQESHFVIIHNNAGNYTSGLFVFNNVVYKIENITNKVLEPTTLVDYTK